MPYFYTMSNSTPLQIHQHFSPNLSDSQRELLDRSVARLHELARQTYPDKEEDHIEADRILCDMLDALGCNELTEAFDAIDKWYA